MGKIKKWLYLQKEGGIAGILIALFLYYLNWDLPINLHVNGITKLIIMVFLYGGLGILLDAMIEPSK